MGYTEFHGHKGHEKNWYRICRSHHRLRGAISGCTLNKRLYQEAVRTPTAACERRMQPAKGRRQVTGARSPNSGKEKAPQGAFFCVPTASFLPLAETTSRGGHSRVRELLPHHRISADYSLPSWEGQVQTELPGKGEGEEQQAQER
jgi:hypothetical protein